MGGVWGGLQGAALEATWFDGHIPSKNRAKNGRAAHRNSAKLLH
jgi:hypothetical protein